jgi:RAB protein geranylgeranyltransferase component A
MKIQAKERDEEYRLLPGFQALEARLGAIEKKIDEIEVTKEKSITSVVKDGEQLKDGKIVEKNTMEQKPVAVEDTKALIDQKMKNATNDTAKVNDESNQIASFKSNADASNATTKKEIKDK